MRINVFTIKLIKESSKNYALDNKKIRSPQDVYDIVRAVLHISEEAQEVFGILALNIKNVVVGLHVISKGTLNVSIVHPREVFKAAMLNNAAFIVCFHNHPSGDPGPSPEDIEFTERLVDAGELLGMEVLDHVIVGDNNFASMKEKGLM